MRGSTILFYKLKIYFIVAIAFIAFGSYLKEHRVWLKKLYPDQKNHFKIVGNVNHPGIYEFDTDDKLEDLIQKAGGLRPGSSRKFVNDPDRELLDGETVNIGVDG